MNTYIGFIPFIFGIIGLLAGKHKLKPVFLSIMLFSALLFLGPQEGNIIYTILFYICIPLRAIENSITFAPFFIFSCMFFVALGIKVYSEKVNKEFLFIFLFILTLCELNLYSQNLYIQKSIRTLIKRTDVTGNAYNTFSETTFNKLLEKHSSDKSFLLRIFDKKKSPLENYYVTKENLSKNDISKLHIIIKPYVFSPLSFQTNPGFTIEQRKQTILPEYSDGSYGYGERFWLFTYNYANRLNFLALIQKKSAATDFFKDFVPYKYIKILAPRSLTYPVPYANILKSDLSEKTKAILLGVNLPVFDFYTNYKIMPEKEIINPADEEKIYRYLSQNIILSNIKPVNLNNNNKLHRQIEILNYNPQDIKIRIITNKSGFLLFRDGYHPCWTAKIDNKNQKIIQANYNSKAIFVTEGEHIIQFKFEPKIYNLALTAYFIGSLAMIIFIILPVFYKKKLTENKP